MQATDSEPAKGTRKAAAMAARAEALARHKAREARCQVLVVRASACFKKLESVNLSVSSGDSRAP